MKTLALVVLLLSVLVAPAVAQQTEAIGHVRELSGTAKIFRGTDLLPATVGVALQRGDQIRTDKPGAVGIVLLDDTTISLGSNSELSLNGFDFLPKEEKFSLVMRMIKGTFVYVSGQISKLAPDTIQLSIPDATIAVRGTKLLVEIE
jgi:hypothetical protein